MSGKRKIKIWIFLSLDGFYVRYGGDTGFLLDYPGLHDEDYGFDEFCDTIDSLIIDRVHYINMKDAIKHHVPDKICYVVSRELFDIHESATVKQILTNGSHAACISQLHEIRLEPGKDMWLMGGNDIISLLMEHDMVDEITLNILPLTMGSGLPLFGENGSAGEWELLSSKTFRNGVLQVRYRAKRKDLR
ncbi:dihydrofolate reductase family protein [uncultured Alistipes sp.]|jgi:bifunctional deaminase-reductase domain protein|uniref:dihydrofolate reductase family protein n=1 Tax=uncultured Alistipes sp. TaxID=538949 RepID=UPI0025D52970|nr:dihydrofolate reductase family protein [uncultured Alistipes sp.]